MGVDYMLLDYLDATCLRLDLIACGGFPVFWLLLDARAFACDLSGGLIWLLWFAPVVLFGCYVFVLIFCWVLFVIWVVYLVLIDLILVIWFRIVMVVFCVPLFCLAVAFVISFVGLFV